MLLQESSSKITLKGQLDKVMQKKAPEKHRGMTEPQQLPSEPRKSSGEQGSEKNEENNEDNDEEKKQGGRRRRRRRRTKKQEEQLQNNNEHINI